MNTLQLSVNAFCIILIYVNIRNFLVWTYETRLCNIMVINGVFFWTLLQDLDSAFKTSPWGVLWAQLGDASDCGESMSPGRPCLLSVGTTWKIPCPLSWPIVSIMFVSDLMAVLYNSLNFGIFRRCKLRSERKNSGVIHSILLQVQCFRDSMPCRSPLVFWNYSHLERIMWRNKESIGFHAFYLE